MKFAKGQSGNPGGRPKANARVTDIAKQYTERAIAVLVEVMDDAKAPPTARTAASTAILDRAWGRPAQALAGPDGEGPIEVVGKEARDAALAAALRADG